MATEEKRKQVASNKKVYHEYEVTDTYEAGVQLVGTEIKSIRAGKANFTDSYCVFINGDLWIKMHISEYSHGGYFNHDPKRDRRLLLTKRELNKISSKVSVPGVSIIPIDMFLTEKGWAKITIGICRGKKKYDKREDLKKKDAKREIDRAMKE